MTTDDSTPQLVDSRRLTGPNLLLGSAGSVLEIRMPGAAAEADAVVAAWRPCLGRLLAAVGWTDAQMAHRYHATGVSLAFSAPVDALYAACDVHEAAWAMTVIALGADVHDSFEPAAVEPPPELDLRAGQPGDALIERLRRTIAEEADDAFVALRAAARAHDVPLLWDDDEVSLGLGRFARTWSRPQLPRPDQVDWDGRRSVPTVLVTGTNGKSTTVRMLAGVLDAHGWVTGSTSTDGIVVGGERVASGDWSGPGGARKLLRDVRVDAGVLEVARGGLLRRGLPVEHADAAIVTNVADDHLGEYGIHSLDDLARTKLLVGAATRRAGVLVLNASDDRLVRFAPDGQRIVWTSLDPDDPVAAAAVARGDPAWVVDGDVVLELDGRGRQPVLDVTAVPATLGGAARHNVANVLSVTAAARSLGIPATTIETALERFRSDAGDNPGRANLYRVGEAVALVDFAHNPHGMTAILDTAARLATGRLIVHLSQAGDRSDDDIAALARTVWEAGPALVIAADVPQYLRGRSPGEVPGIISAALLACGAPADRVLTVDSPAEGVALALARARPGDLLCLMVLAQKEDVRTVLEEAGAVPTTVRELRRA